MSRVSGVIHAPPLARRVDRRRGRAVLRDRLSSRARIQAAPAHEHDSRESILDDRSTEPAPRGCGELRGRRPRTEAGGSSRRDRVAKKSRRRMVTAATLWPPWYAACTSRWRSRWRLVSLWPEVIAVSAVDVTRIREQHRRRVRATVSVRVAHLFVQSLPCRLRGPYV